jgi:hypothetical protein
MSNLDAVLGATPGPPLATLPLNLAPALAFAGVALFVLAALGAIIILVARDTHRPTVSSRTRRPEITAEEEERFLSRTASGGRP